MVVIMVETAIIVCIPFIWISLHLVGEGQGFFVLNLHKNLVEQGSQRRETCEFSYRGLETPVLPYSPVLAIFYPYPALRPPIFLASSAFLLGPATHLLRSCIWLPCTAHLT